MLLDCHTDYQGQYLTYWKRRYQLFPRFDEGIQLDEVSLYSVTPHAIAVSIADKIKCRSIVDAFCCVGGCSIAFALRGMDVIAIELDGQRLKMARNNAKIYGVDNQIRFWEGNFFELVPRFRAEAIFIDPPWGGPLYKAKDTFLLEDFIPSGKEVLATAFRFFPKIIMQVPRQFDFGEVDKLNRPYARYDNFMNDRLVSKLVIIENSEK